MTITVLGVDGNPFDQNSIEAWAGRFLRTYALLKLSGNYLTGGDLLDLTNGGGTPAAPTAVPTAQNRGLVSLDLRPFCKTTASFSAADGQYYVIVPAAAAGITPVPISALNALKLKLMVDIGSEYANGAYGADALGDELIAEFIWAR
jgi:hypothetical protein